MIQVKIFYANNDLRNFSYLIVNENSAQAWVVDPFDEKPMIDYIKKESLVVKGIFNTHQHWDHIKGNSALQNQCNCSVIPRSADSIQLDEGDSLSFLDTPGHTVDHHAFCWKKGEKLLGLFSGDTLFNSGVGNCKNGGNVDELYETTTKLKKLSDDVILYPGHDYVLKNLQFAQSCEPENSDILEALRFVNEANTEEGLKWTLGQEKKVNPFFRLNSEEIQENILKVRTDSESKSMVERNLFKKLRSLRDNW